MLPIFTKTSLLWLYLDFWNIVLVWKSILDTVHYLSFSFSLPSHSIFMENKWWSILRDWKRSELEAGSRDRGHFYNFRKWDSFPLLFFLKRYIPVPINFWVTVLWWWPNSLRTQRIHIVLKPNSKKLSQISSLYYISTVNYFF